MYVFRCLVITPLSYSVVMMSPSKIKCICYCFSEIVSQFYNDIYLITCCKCSLQYVGETLQKLNERFNLQKTGLKAPLKGWTLQNTLWPF